MTMYQFLSVVAATVSLIIAAGGLVVSIISLRRSRTVQRQQLRLQEKQEELVEVQLMLHKKEAESGTRAGQSSSAADVRVSLEGTSKRAKFVIRNWGFGPANKVDLSLKPLQGSGSPLVQGDADTKLPIPRLAPGGEVSLVAALSFDTGAAFDVRWEWTDEDGTHHTESSRVSL